MIINYDTLTQEQIEEYAEFIDWSTIPSRFLTEEIKNKFNSIPQLNARIWLDNLFSQMIIKMDLKEYPNRIFFFIGDTRYMNLSTKNGQLWCSEDRIWFVLQRRTGYNHDQTQLFIKNVVEHYFKSIDLTPIKIDFTPSKTEIEQHFKNIVLDLEITPINDFDVINSIFEETIKKYAISPTRLGNVGESLLEEHFKSNKK